MALDVCGVHEEQMEVLHELRNDVKWIRKIGGWWFSIVGGAIVLLVPLMITFFVYLSSVEKRLALVEQKVADHVAAKK